MKQKILSSLASLVLTSQIGLRAAPVVFWSPDSVEPGNTIMLYGGGLDEVDGISVARLPDGPVALPGVATTAVTENQSCTAIQPSENSVKFQMPAQYLPGIYEVIVRSEHGSGKPVVLNRP